MAGGDPSRPDQVRHVREPRSSSHDPGARRQGSPHGHQACGHAIAPRSSRSEPASCRRSERNPEFHQENAGVVRGPDSVSHSATSQQPGAAARTIPHRPSLSRISLSSASSHASRASPLLGTTSQSPGGAAGPSSSNTSRARTRTSATSRTPRFTSEPPSSGVLRLHVSPARRRDRVRSHPGEPTTSHQDRELSEEPTDVSSHDAPDSPSKGRGVSAKVPKESIGVGIETEFFLTPRHRFSPKLQHDSVGLFADALAKNHNKMVESVSNMALMKSRVGYGEARAGEVEKYDGWLLLTESSIGSKDGGARWPLEMVTPLFQMYQESTWRKEVRQTWSFLQEKSTVEVNHLCGTHVHVSIRRGYKLVDLQKIAQCIIHFEPALEVIVPAERRGNKHARSNWLENRHFAESRKTRAEAIQMIGTCNSRAALCRMMSDGQYNHAWCFAKMVDKRTIEFRKGGASSTVEEALRWAELAVTFVVAAMDTPNVPAELAQTRPDVDGLKRFLLAQRESSIIHDREPTQLTPFWSPENLRTAYIGPTISPYFRTAPAKTRAAVETQEAEKARYDDRMKLAAAGHHVPSWL